MNISNKERTYVFDIDGTICSILEPGEKYSEVTPDLDMISIINTLYESDKNHIILHTARGMRTHGGDLSSINRFVKPELETWLKTHNVKYHQLIMGKPWGPNVTYIDDKAQTPDMFKFGISEVLPLYDNGENV